MIVGYRNKKQRGGKGLKSFIIIGGGASGVLIAAQLLRKSPQAQVRIFERSGVIGAGIAYSTENPNHLLNVRASNMSAFPDDPGHFFDWLQSSPVAAASAPWQADSFAPRCLYRSYLADLLKPYLQEEKPRLFIKKSEIVDILQEAEKAVAITASGQRFVADALIAATGNEAAIAASGGHVSEYWSSKGHFDIPAESPVAIFGTGLSMIDSVISLLDAGHKAEIHAISRRGLIPARHIATQPYPIDMADLPVAEGISALTRRIRGMIADATAAGSDWRAVIDGLRPHTQTIWSSLPLAQRRSFLRHLRPWWDVHRHRMAPAIADRIDAARASGQLHILKGHLLSVRDAGDKIHVRYRDRLARDERELQVATIIDCRGGNPRFSTTRNAAVIGLMERGLARPDPLDLGFDVTPELQLRDAHGEPSGPFFALGPVTKGAFWEVIAVPDIRVQAEKLAQRLL